MRKTVLLPGLCLLFCTSVRGIPHWDDDLDAIVLPDEGDTYAGYSTLSELSHAELSDPEEETILKMAVLETLAEDIADALRAIASETVTGTGENVSDPKRRIKFGRIGGHNLKPIKFPSSWHKPKPIKFPSSWHKPPEVPLPDVSFGLDTEIVVPPPPESSENEE